MDPRGGGVEGELADGDPHAAGPLVAQAEDPLVVGHHDQADVEIGGVAGARAGFAPSSGVIHRPRGLRTIWL